MRINLNDLRKGIYHLISAFTDATVVRSCLKENKSANNVWITSFVSRGIANVLKCPSLQQHESREANAHYRPMLCKYYYKLVFYYVGTTGQSILPT